MNWLADIFSSGASKLVDSVSKGLDNLFTSDDERLKARNILQAEMNKFQLDMQNNLVQYDKQITARWISDNDNLITRLIRPLSYAFILVLFAAIVLSDGNIAQFKVNIAYIPAIQGLLTTMTVAYFGSRGIEKSIKIYKNIKEK